MSAGQGELRKTISSAWLGTCVKSEYCAQGVRSMGTCVKSEDCAQGVRYLASGATHHDSDTHLPAAVGRARKKNKTTSNGGDGTCVGSENCAQSGSGPASGATHRNTDAQLVPDIQHDNLVVRASSLTHESKGEVPVVPSSGSGRDKSPKLCPHNRTKSKCKDCGGSGICEHQRVKINCKASANTRGSRSTASAPARASV